MLKQNIVASVIFSAMVAFVASTLPLRSQIQVGAGGGSSGVTIGTTAITGGTTTRLLYDLAGVVQEAAGFGISGGSLNVPNAGITWGNGNTISNFANSTFALNGLSNLTVNAANSFQFGLLDAASPVAQSLTFQGVSTGTTNTAGVNDTIVGSLSTGSGTSGDLIFQTGGTGAGATARNAAVTAFTIKGATQLVTLPAITSDTAHTDATICEDTTTHALYSGSGTLGICLGTSGRQFKTAFSPMNAGIDEIMKLNLWNYRYLPSYGDGGSRVQYGPTAQDVEAILPDLVGHNENGEAINYDLGAFLPIALHAIQQLKAEVDELKKRK